MRRIWGHNLHFRDSLDRSRELDLDGALLYDEPSLPRRSCWRVLIGPHLRLLGARIVRHGGVRDLHIRAVELVECYVGALVAGYCLRRVHMGGDSERLMRLPLDRHTLDDRSVRPLCLVTRS